MAVVGRLFSSLFWCDISPQVVRSDWAIFLGLNFLILCKYCESALVGKFEHTWDKPMWPEGHSQALVSVCWAGAN